MKKTTPKQDYGYYCDLCGEKICKYSQDFRSCGGHSIEVGKEKIKSVELCESCCGIITLDFIQEKIS